jgi:PAS domain S-box-containing protein
VPRTKRIPQGASFWARLIGVGVGAFAFAYVCMLVPHGADRIAPIWVANAFGLTVLLLSRRSAWPGLAAAFGFGLFLAGLADGNSILLTSMLTLVNVLEILLAAALLVSTLGRKPDMAHAGNLLRYALVAGFASVVSGFFASALLHAYAGRDTADIFVTWALADFAGLLVITPCLVVLVTAPDIRKSLLGRQAWPLALLVAVALATFSQDRYPISFLAPATLLFVTWRLGLAGAAAGLLATMTIAVLCTVEQQGPFSFIEGSVTEQVLMLQAFLAVCFYISIPVAVQRDQANNLRGALSAALLEMQEEARKVRMAQAVANLGYWRFDARTLEVTWSDELYRICGVDPAQPPSLEVVAAVIHSDDRARCEEQFRKAIAHGEPYDLDVHRLVTPGGELKYVRGRGVIEHDDEGKVSAVLGIVLDTTESVLAQQAREAAEDRYRLIAEHAHDIIVRGDMQGRVIYISPSCRALGYEPEEIIGTTGLELVHPDDAERFMANTADLLRGGVVHEVHDRQHRFRRKDGDYVWLEGNPTVLRDGAGQPIELLNVFRDVTARRATEEALADSEARYRTLAENVSDILVRFGPDGIIRYISASCRALGIDPQAAVGKSVLGLMAPDHLEHSKAIMTALFSGAELDASQRRIHRLVTPDSREVWLEGSPKLVRDEAGKVVEVVTVMRDVSVRRAIEAQLRAAKAEAEAAAQVKTEFLANMSHELRTPLTSIIGFTKLATEQRELEPLTRQYVERVADASRALLCTVNDILDFSKLEAGQVTFHPEPVLVGQLAKSALDLFQPQAGAKDLGLILDADLPDGLAVSLDPNRLRQVLLNLIGNAVKFTDAGHITLSVAYDEANGGLSFVVRDTGAGIPEDRLDRLFKRFSQIDGAVTRSGGTGLGLAICKGIVEGMGGSIGVESEVGVGSGFLFSVPAPRAELAAAPGADPGPETVAVGGVRVLVADDHPTNRELVGLILAGVGAEVTEAEDGQAAAELAATWPYDVILMDLRMPRLDGVDALARIRSEPGPNHATPILAFTADADEATNAKLLTLGFQDVVSKPVSPDALISAVARATAFAAGDPEIRDVG